MSENTNLPTPIKNSSFEAPALDDGAFTLTLPTSWNIFDPFGFVPQNPTSTSSRVSAYNPTKSNYPVEVLAMTRFTAAVVMI